MSATTPGLDRVVRRHPGRVHEPGERGDVDDPAGPLPLEHRRERATAAHHAEQVDLDDPLPLVEPGHVDPAAAGDAGVVDEDVEPAPALLDRASAAAQSSSEVMSSARSTPPVEPVETTSVASTSSPRARNAAVSAAPSPDAAPVTSDPARGPVIGLRTCRARAGRPCRGAPRRGRRRAAATGRRSRPRPAGSRSDMPPPPCSWSAMSITPCAMFGTATLIWRDLRQRVHRAADVELPGGVEHQQAGLVDRDPGVGDPLAVAAEVDQRLAERRALQATPAGQLEGHLGQPDQPHAVVHAPRAEPALGDREALAGPGDDVGRPAPARR